MGTIRELSGTDFEKDVKSSSDTYLVDFWAPWCGPCIMMTPILEEYASKGTNVKVAKVNVDESPNIAQEFGITGIPTLIVFKNGKEDLRISGLVQLSALEEKLSAYN